MDQMLKSKLDELEKASKYECWYLVKQPTAFDSLCYLVSFLKEYKNKEISDNLETYINNRIAEIKSEKPSVDISNNALRVAAFFGLITMTSSKYDEAIITDTFNEIEKRCSGDFEKTQLYNDIIQRQIEKMFISSEIDEAYEGTRKEYRLYPVMLLYKVLIELGRSSGNYSISMHEYRYLVATTKVFEDFLETLLLIKVLREDKTNAVAEFEKFREKFDNRLIQALKQLDTLIVEKDTIALKNDKIDEVAKKVFAFEENPNMFATEQYLQFLGSTKTLFELKKPESENDNQSNSAISFDTGYSSEFSRNRILFGAPGTGKSFTLNKECAELLGDNNETDYERVTFHPDYSYANFVGTYKPVMVTRQTNGIEDPDTKYVLSVLNDTSKTAQERYDILYDRFQDGSLTQLPVLLGLYTDETFKTRKKDGSEAIGANSGERNNGRAIRKYVELITEKSRTKDISYEYVPGPFMRVLVKALKNAMTDTPKPFLLIIEEINRANVAAVFGEVFQLLDRDSNGTSEYKIATTYDMRKYLSEELGVDESQVETIKIPNNMFIWATMNSADQGVFPMDTAFKRRWDFTYLGIDDSDEKIRGKYVYLGEDKSQKVEWNKLRKAINNFLAKCKINEDKQLGPYFISKDIVVPENGDEIDREKFIETFKNKVIMYLFEDAAKQKQSKLFEGCFDKCNRYSEICKEFDIKGVGIFNSDIQIDCDVEDINTTKGDSDN